MAIVDEETRKKHDKLLWTRVVSMMHFGICGVLANSVVDDIEEAYEEL